MQDALQKAVFHWNMVAPVICVPKNPDDYEVLLTNIRDAMALIKNTPNSPLTSLVNAMAIVAMEYEKSLLTEQQGGPILALKYLIKLNHIKQSELKEIGSQGVVSEILNGKRSLTLRHVKELAKRFNVSPTVFIED